MFHYFSRSLEWISIGASFVVATRCFKYMGYNTFFFTFFFFFHFMTDVLNLKLCFATNVLTERSGFLFVFHSDVNLLMESPLFYWLQKACSAYPRLTGSTLYLLFIVLSNSIFCLLWHAWNLRIWLNNIWNFHSPLEFVLKERWKFNQKK